MDKLPLPVSDRPAEVGVTINNILTALVLMVMSWVGVNINTMKADIAGMNAYIQTHESRISRNERDIREHDKFHTNIRNGVK